MKKTSLVLFSILFGGLLLRLLLYRYGTYGWDFNTFVSWSNTLTDQGFRGFYGNAWSDYFPGYLYVLRILGEIQKMFSIDTKLLYKLPAIIFDLATSFLIFKIIKKDAGEKWAILGAAFYAFNPAIIVNSTLWGQVDSLTAFFILSSLAFLQKWPYVSSILLAFGTLVKPQAAFVAPLLFILMLKNRWGWGKILFYVGLSFLVFILGFIPLSDGGNLFNFIWSRIASSASQYQYSSVNAFNLWGLWGFWQKDNEGLVNPKLIGIVVTSVVSFVFLKKTFFFKSLDKTKVYAAAAGLLLTTFMFMTRMHERHMLPALAPLLVYGVTSISGVMLYLGLSATYVLNLIYAYTYATNDHSVVLSSFLIKLTIYFNLFFFSVFILKFLGKLDFLEDKIFKLLSGFKDKPISFNQDLSKKRTKLFLVLIIGFALITRVWQLSSPKEEYFDEVYHAFTAKVMLAGDPKAWEWWNTPPEGFAYEWTHPPLAKLGMVLGMKIFGENSFGWRVPGSILGVGIVILIFILTHLIFKDRLLSLISAFLFSLEGLPLVLSRIGMNDTYFLFFAILTLVLFLKDKHFFAAVSFGLAASSKWSAVWLIPIVFLSHFVFRKQIKTSYLWFILLPPLVYLASYIPMFASGHSWEQFLEVQRQMWFYHTNLKATHAYTSAWWSWPLTLRPVYLYTSEEIGGMVSRIYAFGNPALSWFGILSVLLGFYYAFVLKSKKIALLVFSYLIFFVPWAASPRIMFYYHYLPSLPFLGIISAFALRTNKKFIVPVLIIFVVFFLYFYPHWAGLKVPLWLDKSYYWFSSWR